MRGTDRARACRSIWKYAESYGNADRSFSILTGSRQARKRKEASCAAYSACPRARSPPRRHCLFSPPSFAWYQCCVCTSSEARHLDRCMGCLSSCSGRTLRFLTILLDSTSQLKGAPFDCPYGNACANSALLCTESSLPIACSS